MKKNLTAILLVFVMLLTFAPVHTFAQECVHSWGELVEITEPTCTDEGLQKRYCEICYIEETKPIPAIGHHTWGEWYEILEATCTDEGLRERYCEICYIKKTESIPATKRHTWGDWKTIHKPTCIRTGTATRTCTMCHGKNTKTLPKYKKHSWKKWVTAKRATALSKGTKKQTCSKCGKTQKKSIPKLKAKVSLNKKSVTIKSGKQYTLKIKSKTYGDKVKKWASSNKKVATVNSHGKVTGKQKGVATITLKMKSGTKATCKIKVTKPKTNSSQQPGGSDSNPGGSGSNPGGSDSNPGGSDTPTPPTSGYVWIPNSGKKYHSSSSCSGMKGPRQVPLQEAINLGYEPCSRCY